VEGAWKFLAALGAGVGAVFMLRWFWWRINAWSEIAAMVGSLAVFSAMQGVDMPEAYRQLAVAVICVALWLAATLLTRPEEDATLVAFYRKIRPDGPGWRRIAKLAPDVRPDRTLGRSVVCALLGTAVIWLTLPGIGAVIFGQWTRALLCLGGAVVAGAFMFRLMPRTRPV
jgi:hypothetical protein